MIQSTPKDRQNTRAQPAEIKSALPLASAAICLSYNALTVVLCDHLPYDPFQLATYIHIYALVGCLISIVGIYGITSRRPILVKVFAQYLLIDAFVSVICRMLLEEFFIETLYDSNVCDQTFDGLNTGYASMTSGRWESKFKRFFNGFESCAIALATLHFVAIGAMILTSAAQISLAVVMQQFGKQLSSIKTRQLWTIVEVDEEAAEVELWPSATAEKLLQSR
ncbi:hypothetical protein AMS68_006791 [Peltaster fructicola]|uniref:Uncharacterized protein n=1 Tax=Peltaster fructicola TaxID=286661 RepID=A0A6H0Y2P0_9PEZI|nr:hypothetical protein AMS68_006791 [Peltaster fructicola]